jgi:uncharacterized membrane protein SirB2
MGPEAIETFYLQIRAVHVAAVIASGLLFAMRGVAVQWGARWAMSTTARWTSYLIDSVLLTAALMLVSILHQYPFVNGWLTAKVSLLVVYIVLGTFALKRGATPAIRTACFIAALSVYLYIGSIAIEHDPRGVLLLLRH